MLAATTPDCYALPQALSHFGPAPQNPLGVAIRSPDAKWRGRFAEFIDRRIEESLAEAGARQRAPDVPRNLEDTLQDQLLRAGTLDHDGLVLRLDQLDNLARAGVLDATDSRTLRWWLDAECRHALRIELSSSVASLRAYLAPVSIASLVSALDDERLARGRLSATPMMPAALIDSTTQPAPQGPSDVASLAPAPSQPAPEHASDGGASAVHLLDTTAGDPPSTRSAASGEDTPPPPRSVVADDFFEDGRAEFVGPEPASGTIGHEPLETDDTGDDGDCALLQALAPRASDHITPRSGPVAKAAPPAPPSTRTAVSTAEEKAHLRLWRESLEHAEGVQSWDDLERLYLANYLPLAHAVDAGEAGEAAREALRNWSSSFQECYRGAFERVRAGAQRPTMVCDVPQLAFNLARELDITRTRLLLVDGMRFDVGQRVHDKLRMQLSSVAQCVARGVLWAALPAHSTVQLELLARGPAALRKLTPSTDQSNWVARGAAARRLRPVRVGGISLSKLDILEADFAGECWDRETLDRGAAEVAVSVGRSIKQESPGTLVVVFSDHGMSSGEGDVWSSPEQVLVPYDAWLVGERED